MVEKAGVLNLGVEGMMLVGAIAGFASDRATPATRGSAVIGAAAAGALPRR